MLLVIVCGLTSKSCQTIDVPRYATLHLWSHHRVLGDAGNVASSTLPVQILLDVHSICSSVSQKHNQSYILVVSLLWTTTITSPVPGCSTGPAMTAKCFPKYIWIKWIINMFMWHFKTR